MHNPDTAPESAATSEGVAELVVGASVYVRVHERWSQGVILDVSGDHVQVRAMPWDEDVTISDWFEMSEIRIDSPWVEREKQVQVHEHMDADGYECDGCDDCLITRSNPVCFVTVYEGTRHYGGPEEGGWWGNLSHPVCSVPLLRPGCPDEIEEVKAFLKPRFPEDGNIYSMRGGVQYHTVAEVTSGDNAVTSLGSYS